MNATDKFEAWYNTEGIRFYSDAHGSAQGHKDYMNHAFMHGYRMGLEHATEILLDPQNANIIED
jgi:hypothetical protein